MGHSARLQNLSNNYFLQCATVAYIIGHSIAKPQLDEEDCTPPPKVSVELFSQNLECTLSEPAFLKGLDLHTCFGFFRIKTQDHFLNAKVAMSGTTALNLELLNHPKSKVVAPTNIQDLMRQAEYIAIQTVYPANDSHQSIITKVSMALNPRL